ncbi:uncharacterized protein V6R79_019701 [Siganus canaliculatus]
MSWRRAGEDMSWRRAGEDMSWRRAGEDMSWRRAGEELEKSWRRHELQQKRLNGLYKNSDVYMKTQRKFIYDAGSSELTALSMELNIT